MSQVYPGISRSCLVRPDVFDMNKQQYVLTTRNLSLSINGKRLIKSISLQLTSGGTSTILGYNGAGKSLLLRLLHGLILPSEGEVLCNGNALSKLQRQQQAMVFQKPVLLRRSVIENVRFALRVRNQDNRQQAIEMLRAVGLDAQAKQPARLLSGGEQQRLAMARALANDPDILFLDEATAGLDPASLGWIEQRIKDISESGTKVIMVTHDLGMARRLSDEILFLDHGQLVAQSSATDFFGSQGRNQPNVVTSFLNGELPSITGMYQNDLKR